MPRKNMAGSDYPASYTGRPAAEMELEHRAVLDAQPMVVRCGVCPGWSVSACAVDARVAFREHLLLAHPDVKPSRRRRGSAPGVYARSVSVWRDEGARAEAMVAVEERLRTTHRDDGETA